MFKLYQDTEKELFTEDYKQLPGLDSLSCTQLIELTENLYETMEKAYLNGNDMLAGLLYDDIVTVNKKRIFDFLLTVSSGRLASIIGSTKYSDTDKALHMTWQYTSFCEEENIFNIGTYPGNIESLIKEVYTGERKLDD